VERSRLRPLPAFDVLDGAARTVARSPGALIASAARAVVPMTVVGVLAAAYTPLEVVVADVRFPARAAALAVVAVAAYQYVVAAAAKTFLTTYLDAPAHLIRQPIWRTTWVGLVVTVGIGMPVAAGLVVARILTATGADVFAPGSVALGVGVAVSLWVSWSVAVPVVTVDGLGGGRSLERSHVLVRGRRMRSLAILVAVGLLAFAVHVVVDVAAAQAGSTLGRVVAAGVVAFFVGPVYASVVTALYVDLRLRLDGFPLVELPAPIDDSADPWDPYGRGHKRVVPMRRSFERRGPSWER